ncbi:TBC1 domain family member 2B [Trichinella spiralis]|uniref:TBC1 domain family member 2B n=1 Tax=Trichinella spiralis TaxID=6334 RepID=A0A0V1BB11_TRISP|nr:TBC1 domain family member 2B [Trichinella spiralis]
MAASTSKEMLPPETGKRHSGYLKLIETIGPLKSTKKRWFVLEENALFLYYYRSEREFTPVGRIYLPTAVFTYDPKQNCTFVIRSNGESLILEAPDCKSRLYWLQALQTQRRICIESQAKEFGSEAELFPKLPDLAEFLPSLGFSSADNFSIEPAAETEERSSVFYVDEKGGLHENSFQYPVSEGVNYDDKQTFSNAADATTKKMQYLKSSKISAAESAYTLPCLLNNERIIKASQSATKLNGFNFSSFPLLRSKKNYDELITVVNALKERCLDLHDEVAASRDLIQVLQNSIVANKDQTAALQRLINATGNESERLQFYLDTESQRAQLQAENEKFKSELKKATDKVKNFEKQMLKQVDDMESYRQALRSKDEIILRLTNECCTQKQDSVNSDLILDAVEPFFEDIEITDVVDQEVDKMKDLVSGYETQNQFLNKEILELHNLIRHMESREISHTKRYYNMEAQFYQLKSRYLLLLNHFRPNKVLSLNVVEELVKEARKTFTDDLGFYFTASHAGSGSLNEELVQRAGDLQRKSDQISSKQKKEADELYLDWLTRWDSFLVNFSGRLLEPNAELKQLIRSGVPHAYRARIHSLKWALAISPACAVRVLPNRLKIDLDLARTLPHNRHFEDMQAEKIEPLRRVLYAYRQHNADIGYCQVDRFDLLIGLNRLAAVALLYLSEEDAFWALVAIIEHLQPRNYYGRTVIAAQADQRVLDEIVHEKLPKVYAHLRSFEVDLSLFTFSWFLTIFVDNFPHETYLNIWDCFLFEGNKVLFRFAIAALKLKEDEIVACKSSGALHSCLSKIGESMNDYKALAQVAFRTLNPFSQKPIEQKRQLYLAEILMLKFSQQFHAKLKELNCPNVQTVKTIDFMPLFLAGSNSVQFFSWVCENAQAPLQSRKSDEESEKEQVERSCDQIVNCNKPKDDCSLPLYSGKNGGEQQVDDSGSAALFDLLREWSVQSHADAELNRQKLAQMHGYDDQRQQYAALKKKFAQLENMFDKIGRRFDDMLCLSGRYSLDQNLLCLPSKFVALTSHLKIANDFVQIWERNLVEMENRLDKIRTIFWQADLTEWRDKLYSANLASIIAQVRSEWWSNWNNLENAADVFDDLPTDQQHLQEAVVQFRQQNETLRQNISSCLHSIANISTDRDLVPILKAIAAVQDTMLSDYEQLLRGPKRYVSRLISDVESTLIYSDKFCETFSTLSNNLLKAKQLLENAANLKTSFLESEGILKRNLALVKMVIEPTTTRVDQWSQETACWHLASEIDVNNLQKRVDQLVDIYCRCSAAVVDLESKDLKSLHNREMQLHARLNDLDDLYDLFDESSLPSPSSAS